MFENSSTILIDDIRNQNRQLYINLLVLRCTTIKPRISKEIIASFKRPPAKAGGFGHKMSATKVVIQAKVLLKALMLKYTQMLTKLIPQS